MSLELSDFMSDHRFIILIDIRGYSELTDDQQLSVIQTVTNKSLQFVKDSGYDKEKIFSSFIPTGDGFYIVGDATLSLFWGQICVVFALSLRNALLLRIASLDVPCQGIKIAVHFGTTKTFTDIAGNKNFVGAGMNDTARLLDPINKPEITSFSQDFYKHENSVIISEDALNKVESLQSMIRQSVTFDVKAKHDRYINCQFIDLPEGRVYNVFSTP